LPTRLTRPYPLPKHHLLELQASALIGRGPHLLLADLISFFTATMICLIAILDHPFCGHIGVSSEAFEHVYNQIMLKY
jgi:hypothetical protein